MGYAPADAGPEDTPPSPGTCRYRVALTRTGTALALTLSNADGDAPLGVSRVLVAPAGPGTGLAHDPARARPVLFGGGAGVVSPRWGAVIGDPATLPAAWVAR